MSQQNRIKPKQEKSQDLEIVITNEMIAAGANLIQDIFGGTYSEAEDWAKEIFKVMTNARG